MRRFVRHRNFGRFLWNENRQCQLTKYRTTYTYTYELTHEQKQTDNWAFQFLSLALFDTKNEKISNDNRKIEIETQQLCVSKIFIVWRWLCHFSVCMRFCLDDVAHHRPWWMESPQRHFATETIFNFIAFRWRRWRRRTTVFAQRRRHCRHRCLFHDSSWNSLYNMLIGRICFCSQSKWCKIYFTSFHFVSTLICWFFVRLGKF